MAVYQVWTSGGAPLNLNYGNAGELYPKPFTALYFVYGDPGSYGLMANQQPDELYRKREDFGRPLPTK